ncbi:tyrosine-type recombinase/integrase [Bremerella sp. T1]|uniref:tyrosine-type recombinase/integrase n=1 Tax=Bremerella sp. TYQ1 TaxID=3119568 RepID=UPI001CCCA25C|nr:site-specific integrase [Bremerella volcania]UBM37712.1 site-specific integrase [Bremerella volcania]
MARKTKQRRQSHGSAWHWKQTDCWYYTLPGTKKRVALFDEQGERIRGKDNKEAAEISLAREKLAWDSESNEGPVLGQPWLVARVCSNYLVYTERSQNDGSVSEGYHRNATQWLNDLCSYCGALPVSQLKRGHILEWVDQHETWKSPATRRCIIAVVMAAFNRVEETHGIVNPIKGIKLPKAEPRLTSFSPEDEKAIYKATEPCFGNFLFAAIHTGLRPFSELAQLKAEDVEETPRGMMWRVYASKTKKTRKIPVRPEVAELTRQLMKSAPRGSGLPVYRNTLGKPWKGATGVVRFIDLREKLGWNDDPLRKKYSCYTSRHTFAHRMLSGFWNNGAGCTIETLAELMGDTPKVAYDHYGKEWGKHYQDPLWKAIGESTPAAGKQAKSPPAKRKKSTASSAIETKPKRTKASSSRNKRHG